MKPFALLLFALVPLAARAAPTPILSHEGRLFDAADRPVHGAVDFTFALYGQASGGTPAWSESRPAVAVHQGLYAVRLGEATAIPTSVFAADDVFLSVSVGTAGEMLPRLRLGTVPFAVVAATASDAMSLGGFSADAYLTRDDAEETYAKQSALASYLKVDDADTTYARLTDLAPYLKSADADGAFARKSDLSLYAKLSDLSTLASAEQLAPFAKTSDVVATFLSKSDATASYLSKTDAASAYAPKGADLRNLLHNGSFESWSGLFQNFGFNGTTASTYAAQLPIGWTGIVAGNTSTPQGVDPSAAVSSYLTTGRVLSRQTDTPKEGSSYVRLTFPAVTREAGIVLKVGQLALEPNRTYTLAFWTRVQAGTNTQNDLVITVVGTPFTVGGAASPLPTSWTQMGPYTFTTGANVSGASLVIQPRGLGGTVDIDGVGLWRGTAIGELADPRLVCPGDMVPVGDFCIEPAVTQRGAISWGNANLDCRFAGRRLCKTDELLFAAHAGVISANGPTSLWGYVSDGSGDNGYCRVNISSVSWFLRVYCDGSWSNLGDAGRICCASR
jgi:hypothetical protein